MNVYRATSTPNRTNRTSLSAVFHTKFTFQNWNANDHSIRTGVELRPPMSESSTKISKFYAHSDSEHKFHKARIEIWLPIGFKLRYPWLVTCSYNHRLGICWVGVPRREPAVQLLMEGSLIKHFTSLKLWKRSQIPQPSPRVTLTLNKSRTKTNHHWLNHLQTLDTQKITPPRSRKDWGGMLTNPWGNTRKS